MANVIYRGPVDREPQTINAPVNGALVPGTFVTYDGTDLNPATAATGRLMILSHRRFYDQGIDDAYVDGETGVAYRVEPEQEYQARMAAGTYSVGDTLTVDSNSRLAAATAGDAVVAIADAGATVSAGDLLDVVISAGFAEPA